MAGNGGATNTVANGCSTLSSVQNVSPTVADKYRTPYQLISFSIPCPGTTTVTIYWYIPPSDVNNSFILRKYGSTVVGGTSNSWYSYPATITRDSIGGRPVVKATYTLTNNQLGDESGFDGVIVDPVALAVDGGGLSGGNSSIVSTTTVATSSSARTSGSASAVATIVKTGGIGQIIAISAVSLLALMVVSYITLRKKTQQKVNTIE